MVDAKKTEVRVEKDSMGDVHVPAWAYWGAQTQRAKENFPISGYKIPLPMLRGIALVKRYAAEVNTEMGLVDAPLAEKNLRGRRRSH